MFQLFLFSPYELASFADGALFAAISFEEALELFQPKYLEIPERYTAQLLQMTPFLFDLDDDGSFEEICVTNREQKEEGAYVELCIAIDGKEYSEEVFTNPDHFLLEGRTELLSTLSGVKEYCVDETGMPRTESEYLTVENGVGLEDYQLFIQGMEQDEVFEGMVYAG